MCDCSTCRLHSTSRRCLYKRNTLAKHSRELMKIDRCVSPALAVQDQSVDAAQTVGSSISSEMDGCCILKATALVTWSSEQGHPGVNSGENGSPVTSTYRVISVLAGCEQDASRSADNWSASAPKWVIFGRIRSTGVISTGSVRS